MANQDIETGSEHKKYFVAAVFIVLIALILAVKMQSSNKNSDCGSIEEQKARDDCHHALAHETFNRSGCSKIYDNETKEHCFGHVPE